MRKTPWDSKDSQALAGFLYRTHAGDKLLSVLREHVQEKCLLSLKRFTPGCADTEASVRLGCYEGMLDIISFLEYLADHTRFEDEENKEDWNKT